MGQQVQAFIEETQNSHKEVHENMGPQVESLKEATQKSHRQLWEDMYQYAEALKEESQKSLHKLGMTLLEDPAKPLFGIYPEDYLA